MVAMPLRRFSSAARNTSYFERVTPGPNTATGQPPAGFGLSCGGPWEQQDEPDPRRAWRGAPAPAGSAVGGSCGPIGSTAVPRNEPKATVPALAEAGELSKTVSSTNGSPDPDREVVEPSRPDDVRGRVDPALAADDEVEPPLTRPDAGGGVGLPAVELAHHLPELAGGGHRRERRSAGLAVHTGGHHDLVAGGLAELRGAAGRRASSPGHHEPGEADAPGRPTCRPTRWR